MLPQRGQQIIRNVDRRFRHAAGIAERELFQVAEFRASFKIRERHQLALRETGFSADLALHQPVNHADKETGVGRFHSLDTCHR